MSARNIITLRRLPLHPVPDDDSVILAGIVLRCSRCRTEWPVPAVGPFSDEIRAEDARCPRCAENAPEPPTAA